MLRDILDDGVDGALLCTVFVNFRHNLMRKSVTFVVRIARKMTRARKENDQIEIGNRNGERGLQRFMVAANPHSLARFVCQTNREKRGEHSVCTVFIETDKIMKWEEKKWRYSLWLQSNERRIFLPRYSCSESAEYALETVVNITLLTPKIIFCTLLHCAVLSVCVCHRLAHCCGANDFHSRNANKIWFAFASRRILQHMNLINANNCTTEFDRISYLPHCRLLQHSTINFDRAVEGFLCFLAQCTTWQYVVPYSRFKLINLLIDNCAMRMNEAKVPAETVQLNFSFHFTV